MTRMATSYHFSPKMCSVFQIHTKCVPSKSLERQGFSAFGTHVPHGTRKKISYTRVCVHVRAREKENVVFHVFHVFHIRLYIYDSF